MLRYGALQRLAVRSELFSPFPLKGSTTAWWRCVECSRIRKDNKYLFLKLCIIGFLFYPLEHAISDAEQDTPILRFNRLCQLRVLVTIRNGVFPNEEERRIEHRIRHLEHTSRKLRQLRCICIQHSVCCDIIYHDTILHFDLMPKAPTANICVCQGGALLDNGYRRRAKTG